MGRYIVTDRPRARGRLAKWAAILFFSLYVLNVLAGKVSVMAGATTPVHAGDVPEFLILLAAIICFIIAALNTEATR